MHKSIFIDIFTYKAIIISNEKGSEGYCYRSYNYIFILYTLGYNLNKYMRKVSHYIYFKNKEGLLCNQYNQQYHL